MFTVIQKKSKMSPREPAPNLKLKPREKPFQKITINSMPKSIYDLLKKRADRLNKAVPQYCRVVLEHAIENQENYTGPLKSNFPAHTCIPGAIHIPIVDKNFMGRLVKWDPYGVEKKNAIALSIIKKHLDVRSW